MSKSIVYLYLDDLVLSTRFFNMFWINTSLSHEAAEGTVVNVYLFNT